MNIRNSSHYLLNPDSYYNHLKIIKGVRFTPREVDVIACLLCGKVSKSTANILSIEENTVETHKYNIMRKLECNSREGITHFIEHSDKYTALKNHYLLLRNQTIFKKHLEQASRLPINSAISCLIVYEKSKENTLLIGRLEKDIRFVGLKTEKVAKENQKSLAQLLHRVKLSEVDLFIYVVSIAFIEKLKAGDNHAKNELAEFLQIEDQSKANVLLLLEGEKPLLDIPEEIRSLKYIDLGANGDYYLCFFEILQNLLPHASLEKITNDFKEQYETISASIDNTPSPQLDDSNQIANPHRPSIIRFASKVSIGLISGSAITLLVRCEVLRIPMGIKGTLESTEISFQVVRSELAIPSEYAFLKRTELMKKIEEKLNGDQVIQTVALVGTGGSGKTTIARQYARKRNSSIIWEINAETNARLIESFENLANELSKTTEEKSIVKELQGIKNSKEREEKIIQFVKGKLVKEPNWILIYDNVEKFSDIQKYFPYDPKSWGNGSVIITTRDSTIQNNKHITNMIHIGELSPEEKLSLFMSIGGAESKIQMTPVQREEAIKFLDKIPPFPLDVSLAAYYLKATNISYNQYIDHLSQNSKEFDNVQKKILEGAGEYTKTRYSIISLSVKRLIESHRDFGDLLLFISVLDSQNIPRDLLNNYRNSALVDNFIYHLKRYSFITSESSTALQAIPVFSIHRDTHKMILASLVNELDLRKNPQKLHDIANSLENYIIRALDKEDSIKINLLLSHCISFLKYEEILNDHIKNSIEGELGGIYLFLGYYLNAQTVLEESVEKLKGVNGNYLKKAKVFGYLGNTYRELGNKKKAKDLLEDCLAIYKKHLPEHHAGYARALGSLGSAYRELGDYEKAKEVTEKSLTIYREFLSNDHAGIALSLANLGNIYENLGDYEKAIDVLKRSLSIYKTQISENHKIIPWILIYLGNVYRDLGRYEDAKTMFEQSVAIFQKHFPEAKIDNAWALLHLGNVYCDLGNYKKAKHLIEESSRIYNQNFPEKHMCIAWISTYLGKVYRKLGLYEQAESSLECSRSIYMDSKDQMSDDHVDIAWVLAHLGSMYNDLGTPEKARYCLEESLLIYEKHLSQNHIWIVDVFSYLGVSHIKLGNYEKAKNLLEKALTSYEKHYGPKHTESARILLDLGNLYLLQNDINRAESCISEALTIFDQKQHPESYRALEILAELFLRKSIAEKDILQAQKYKKQAIDYQKQSLSTAKKHFPADSAHINRIQTKLTNLEKV